MITGRWWDRYPSVLAAEQASLEELGIEWLQDTAALDAGVMRLQLDGITVGHEVLDLVVTYPDLYPYFRFEMDAPGLSLPYHQNPFHKNLCLMARASDIWHVGYTVGEMLKDQLPKVLQAARLESAPDAGQLEEQQAEPFSDYYSYLENSIVLVEGCIGIDRSVASGTFKIGTRGPIGPAPDRPLRGALTKVFDDTGRTVAEASQSLIDLYGDRVLKGPWLRLNEPPRVDGPEILQFLGEQDPRFKRLPKKAVEGGVLSVGAAMFPEEHSWRDQSGDGWIFACEFVHNFKQQRR